jgi:hypothetical protein
VETPIPAAVLNDLANEARSRFIAETGNTTTEIAVGLAIPSEPRNSRCSRP